MLLFLVALHGHIKRDVRRLAPGLVSSHGTVLWRQRTLLSISVWRDLDSVYGIGSVQRHTYATRVPIRLGVATSSGVFTFTGDSRRVLFGSQVPPRSPLSPLKPNAE
ncbi:hypothetical protein ACIBO1_24925 [Micromonospora sp. NPDC049903]|uniref:hypothetical protein n=1 Tax=Micromonospora sp. NPDC049903 TaxID=3364276 RepID=UPI00379560DB